MQEFSADEKRGRHFITYPNRLRDLTTPFLKSIALSLRLEGRVVGEDEAPAILLQDDFRF
jgi:hypothetical protein